RNACEARLPVDHNRACAARSLETAGFWREVADLVPQEPEKRRSAVDEFGPLFAIQGHLDGYFCHNAAHGKSRNSGRKQPAEMNREHCLPVPFACDRV